MARKYLITLLSLFIFVSCSDIFSTRDPEEPYTDGDSYISESVSGLLTNMKTSLLSLDKNFYESLLIDSLTTEYTYTFISNSQDISEQDIFNDWGIDNEKIFINNLKTSGSNFTDIDLSLNDSYNEAEDSLNIELDYSMNFTDSSSVTTQVIGSFTLKIIKVDGHFWYIKNWIDENFDLSTGQKSFSKLKEPFVY
ncbi:MAG: hypothetical protein JXR69_02470 [Candidatus Delongbacteria bacterium]|nr:hypothetical protein [Candidatus Delongbacteria bacterium]